MPIFDRESTLRKNDEYRRQFEGYMDKPCTRHHATIGQPCWQLPSDSMAVCGPRMGVAK